MSSSAESSQGTSGVNGTDGMDGMNGANGMNGEIAVEYEEVEDTADVLFLGTGVLSRWAWPSIEGLHNFKGKLLHSAQWDIHGEGQAWQEGVKDWKDKNVGVIGLVRSLPLLHFQSRRRSMTDLVDALVL